MGAKTRIEWTDGTWNPVRGCSRASDGCKNCYAARLAARFSGHGNPFEGLTRQTTSGPDWTGKVRLATEKMVDPLRWETPRRVFVNSVSDTFNPAIPEAYLTCMAEVMQMADWHTFQVLTKRAERMRELLNGPLMDAAQAKHIVWGVTVENRRALGRLDDLRETPARWRSVSFEPLLEDPGEVNLNGIDWIIVGGESGPNPRPFREEWVRSLRDQATEAGACFFFKQFGGRSPKKNGCKLDGREYKEWPLIETGSTPNRRERQAMIRQVETKLNLLSAAMPNVAQPESPDRLTGPSSPIRWFRPRVIARLESSFQVAVSSAAESSRPCACILKTEKADYA